MCILCVCVCLKANSGGPKEWGSQVTPGLIAFCSQFFTCSSPHVDRCSNPLPGDPLKVESTNIHVIANSCLTQVLHQYTCEYLSLYIYIYIYIHNINHVAH